MLKDMATPSKKAAQTLEEVRRSPKIAPQFSAAAL
jgi:hypothetical protein